MDEIERILQYTDKIELKHYQGWYTAVARKGDQIWAGRALSLDDAYKDLWDTFLDRLFETFEAKVVDLE